jgi:hypothetical protein
MPPIVSNLVTLQVWQAVVDERVSQLWILVTRSHEPPPSIQEVSQIPAGARPHIIDQGCRPWRQFVLLLRRVVEQTIKNTRYKLFFVGGSVTH